MLVTSIEQDSADERGSLATDKVSAADRPGDWGGRLRPLKR
jgi:hypothetical protein